jgi:hypothetical protein
MRSLAIAAVTLGCPDVGGQQNLPNAGHEELPTGGHGLARVIARSDDVDERADRPGPALR